MTSSIILVLQDTSWKETLQSYLQLDKNVSGGKLVLTNEMECLQLHCLLRDFSSLLQLVILLLYFFLSAFLRNRFLYVVPFWLGAALLFAKGWALLEANNAMILVTSYL